MGIAISWASTARWHMSAAAIAKLAALRNKRQCVQGIAFFIPYGAQRSFVKHMTNYSPTISFFITAWKLAKKLPHKHKLAMQHTLSQQADLLNILWMYRLKEFYGIYGDATFAHLIPVGGRINATIMSKLANCRTTQELLHALAGSIYVHVFYNFEDIETRVNNAIQACYAAHARKSYIALVCMQSQQE